MNECKMLADGTVLVGDVRVGVINGRSFKESCGTTHILPAHVDPIKAFGGIERNGATKVSYVDFCTWISHVILK